MKLTRDPAASQGYRAIVLSDVDLLSRAIIMLISSAYHIIT